MVCAGVVTPQFKSQYTEAPSRASYGSTAPMGQNGYPVQVGAPPSLAQLQRHMMGARSQDKERDLELGDTSPADTGDLGEGKVRKSDSNNTLSSRNLELHESELVNTEPGAQHPALASTPPMDLDQTTMIGSALDLDSLDGDRQAGAAPAEVSQQSSSQSGSQIGLLKLSAV